MKLILILLPVALAQLNIPANVPGAASQPPPKHVLLRRVYKRKQSSSPTSSSTSKRPRPNSSRPQSASRSSSEADNPNRVPLELTRLHITNNAQQVGLQAMSATYKHAKAYHKAEETNNAVIDYWSVGHVPARRAASASLKWQEAHERVMKAEKERLRPQIDEAKKEKEAADNLGKLGVKMHGE